MWSDMCQTWLHCSKKTCYATSNGTRVRQAFSGDFSSNKLGLNFLFVFSLCICPQPQSARTMKKFEGHNPIWEYIQKISSPLRNTKVCHLSLFRVTWIQFTSWTNIHWTPIWYYHPLVIFPSDLLTKIVYVCLCLIHPIHFDLINGNIFDKTQEVWSPSSRNFLKSPVKNPIMQEKQSKIIQ